MLSITQLFGSSKESKAPPYMPRQIDLSGNIVNFSMPENFSPDFPADDLVENFNLNDSSVFKKNNSVALLRRWWDFKDNSFFSKEMGTMMIDNTCLSSERIIRRYYSSYWFCENPAYGNGKVE